MRRDFKRAKSEPKSRDMIVVVNVLNLLGGQRCGNVHVSRWVGGGGRLRGRWRRRRRRRMSGRSSDPGGSTSLRDYGADRRRVFGPVL